MKRIMSLCIGLTLPLHVFALEYRNLSLLYTDAPFIPAEAAGISVLTSLNAVQGNPDGTFRPNRTVNRAEFLKIVLSSHPKIRISPSDADSCFRDVMQSDWFAPYVCLAKKRGMVSGYDDGDFKPERSVNYAEALKILGELYEYIAYSADDEEWYAGYVRAAQYNKTALPASIKYDRALTRGQMARLAAAYRAHYDGELETYRLSEKNLDLVIAKEIANNVSSQESSGESSSSASSVEAEPVQNTSMPATSHFLMLGTTELIASGYFVPRDERVLIKNVTVKFRDEPKNLRAAYLVDAEGARIAELKPDTYDNTDLTWKVEGDAIETYALPVSGKELGIQAVLQSRDNGFAAEIIEVKWISMTVSPIGEMSSYQIIGSTPSYPPHQTVQASITAVRSVMSPIMDIGSGENMLLAEVEVSGEKLNGAELRLNHLTFTISDKQGVTLSDFTLGASHSITELQCSLGEGVHINCLNIPASIGIIEHGSILLQLRGTMTVNEAVANPTVRIDLVSPGSISTTINPGEIGDVRWGDGTGAYNWLNTKSPVAEGAVWK